ncbi:ataxin-1 [Polypterus senegalus]|uniref:ataxin-1 n=1 Tax=Polypterus senegalus TaxID=55291 RepID=UPI00196508D2|nr:ataxin-1 [Polypterus senegalus]XP_039593719.1 ataxin-1 [Polypterus senegalus]XP_039593720.1 ataxin-1 [Polypterus senegalus]XP_039593722.1 ataxin-1 [Polypterus senegalus]
MKSNQERSNECLPPKKREIPPSNLPSDEKPVLVAPATESQRGENLAWLASVASGQDGTGSARQGGTGSSVEAGLPQDADLYKAPPTTGEFSSSSSSSSSSSARASRPGPTITTISTVYPSALSQSVQYAQLPHTFQFISPPNAGPYASYIPSQLISPSSTTAATSPSQRSQLEAYTAAVISQAQASKAEHHLHHQAHHVVRPPGLVAAGTPPPPPSQYVQIAGSPSAVSRAVSSPPAHIPLHIHSHSAVIPQALALGGPSQVVVHYSDGHVATAPSKKHPEEGRTREVLNGEMEKGRHYGLSQELTGGKPGAGAKGSALLHHHHHHHHHHHQQQQQQHRHFEARHVMLPAEYNAQENSGIRTSLMLVPNSHSSSSTDLETTREHSPSLAAHEKAGLGQGKPSLRPSYALSSSQLSSDGLKATVATLSPHTVIQTTHNATEQLSMGLPATSFYPAASQQPIIGYITSSGTQPPQQAIGFHPQHLVIPGNSPLIIPVGGGGSGEVEGGPTIVTSSQPFVPAAITKSEPFAVTEPLPSQPSASYHATVMQAQIHLPVVQPIANTSPAGTLPPAVPTPTLPPYFMKGSIIQLADGELKKVEDLKTEDFIQSAEISNDLKIDSSTVERIEGSQNASFAIIQFAVGEHRAQVSVEVLVEYPFFVFGQGWSSCCPERTTQLFDLPCTKLSVGDVCISLTLKNLKNGSLKKGQPVDPSSSILLKAPKNDSLYGSRGRYTEQENGIGQRGAGGGAGGGGGGSVPASAMGTQTRAENGELKFQDKTPLPVTCKPLVTKTDAAGGKPTARKRRWSAPESRKVEKSEEEPPLTLPKPTFIPQEVKLCIEGRSNLGK